MSSARRRCQFNTKITIYFETLYLGESLSLRDLDVMGQFERIDKKQQEEIRPVLMVDADVKAKNIS